MNKAIRIILISFLVLNACAQEKGINFFHGSFKEALMKAQDQNKKVFVDIYTEWCGPCKKMAKTVFTTADAGKFYNEHFICLKINAEKGEGVKLREHFGVSGYPTLLYLNSDGEVLKKITSSVDVPTLIQLGKSVLNVDDNFSELKEKYLNKTITLDEHYQYLIQLKAKGLDHQIQPIFDEYFVLAAKKNIDEQLLNMINEYASSSDDISFSYLINHRQEFNKVLGKEKVDKSISEFYMIEFSSNFYEDESEYRTAKKVLGSRVDLSKQESMELDANFYYMAQKEDEYIELSKKMVKKYYKNDALSIANILGSIRFVRKKENLRVLEQFGKQAIALDNSFMNNLQLAIVYCALKETDKANDYFAKAEKVGKANKDPYLKELDNIKQVYMKMFE